MRSIIIGFVLIGVFVVSYVTAQEPYTYIHYDLGEPGIPASFNDRGVLTRDGDVDDPEIGHSVFTWDNGIVTDLSELWDEGILRDGGRLAENGWIALRGYTPGSPNNAYLLRGSGVYEFEFPEECFDIGIPNAISSDGSIVTGNCRFDDQNKLPERLVIYTTPTMDAQVIGLPSNAPKGSEASPYGMNDHAVIVGILDYNDEFERRAFIYQDGVIGEFENPWGGIDTALLDINNLGLAVGEGADEFGNSCGFSYDTNTGEVVCLDYGHPLSLNDRGHAVGWQNFDWVTHAALYADGETIDLNPFLPPDHFNPNARWINNYGWITGDSRVDGEAIGWLLVPDYDKGDYDGDGDVDFQDFGKFQECFAAEPFQGPEGGLHVGCSVFDFDHDVDLDLDDYSAFQAAFTGPTAPDMNPYGPG